MTTSSQAHREGNAVVHLCTHARGWPAGWPLLLYTRIGGKAPAPALPYTTAAYNPAENTDPARNYSRIPLLGVANNPIQFGLPLDTNAQLAARVQA